MENEKSYGLDSMFLLKSLNTFKDLEMEAIYAIIKASDFRTLQSYEIVGNREETNENIYLVLTGEIGLFDAAGGKCLYTVRSGDALCELSLFKNRKDFGTIRALKNSYLLEFEREEFIRLLLSSGAIAACFVKGLGSRLRSVLEGS